MIHPQMATLLVYLFTDAAATPAELKRLLLDACEQTFNCISIDGDTPPTTCAAVGEWPERYEPAATSVQKTCGSTPPGLPVSAEQIVSDGEGSSM